MILETPPPGYMSEDGDNHEQNGTDNMGMITSTSFLAKSVFPRSF